jgi:copper chaperone CopZ
MKQANISVKGMHCKSCEMILEDSLSEIPGVIEAKASLKEGIVTVKYEETELEKIKEIIRQEGYEA